MTGVCTVQAPCMDFDCLSIAPPSVTAPELLPVTPSNFEKRIEFPLVASAGLAESAGSEMSALESLLDEFSSKEMAQEFDAWLKDMPGPGLS